MRAGTRSGQLTTRPRIRLSRRLAPTRSAAPPGGPRAGAAASWTSLRPYRRLPRPVGRLKGTCACGVEARPRLLAQGVELHVVGGRVQKAGVVLELPEPAVAVEAEKRPYHASRVVMVDMVGWRRPTDGAQAALLLKKVVGLFGGNPVAPRQVICAIPPALVRVSTATNSVARQTIAAISGLTCSGTDELVQRLHLPTIPTPLVASGDCDVCRPLTVHSRLRPPCLATAK